MGEEDTKQSIAGMIAKGYQDRLKQSQQKQAQPSQAPAEPEVSEQDAGNASRMQKFFKNVRSQFGNS